MKKVLLLFIIILLSFSLIACNANSNTSNQNESSDNPTSENSSTTFQPTTQIETTVEPTTEELTTEPQTENITLASYQEYLSHLQSHSKWFTERYYYSVNGNKPIALYDLDNNGISELIYVHPAEDQSHGEVHLSIYTFSDGRIKKLYEDYIFSLAGSDPACSVFIGNDSKLYSMGSNGYNSAVIRYDYDGFSISTDYLAESKGRGTADPDSVIYHKNGELVTGQEYNEYRLSITDSATIFLMITYQNTNGVTDISMSYEEACQFLNEKQ